MGALGLKRSGATVGELWEHLIETVAARGALDRDSGRMLEHYLRHGTLATRISKAVGLFPDRNKLKKVYVELCEALATGTPFAPPAAAESSLGCEHSAVASQLSFVA